ncbi:hypothetical protein Bbelb_310260 [Branchiostoma belcheri]|nr:hypothetical protein Bbelb_310260 [Branchiostoma belcheri]
MRGELCVAVCCDERRVVCYDTHYCKYTSSLLSSLPNLGVGDRARKWFVHWWQLRVHLDPARRSAIRPWTAESETPTPRHPAREVEPPALKHNTCSDHESDVQHLNRAVNSPIKLLR